MEQLYLNPRRGYHCFPFLQIPPLRKEKNEDNGTVRRSPGMRRYLHFNS